jgi:hypothetical protein
MVWNEGTPVRRRRGQETFRDGPRDLGVSLREFWEWSGSDLLGNTARGVVAEFLVAHALGAAGGVRTEWAPFDVITPEGVHVEVKSSAYVQSWRQARPSLPSFGVGRRQAWNQASGALIPERKRRADVYVFCLLAEEDPKRVDPLDVAQWQFFVLAREILDERVGAGQRVTLKALRGLEPRLVPLSGLRKAVGEAAM